MKITLRLSQTLHHCGHVLAAKRLCLISRTYTCIEYLIVTVITIVYYRNIHVYGK